MKATDYIISILNEWEKKFPSIVVRYAYEAKSHFHVIEVTPNELFTNDDEYARAEMKLWDNFFEMYPNEEILITEPDTRNDMSDILYPCKQEENIKFCYGSTAIEPFIPFETRTATDTEKLFKSNDYYTFEISNTENSYNNSNTDSDYALAA